MIEAYPLAWPTGKPRAKYKEHSRLRSSFAAARDSVVAEVRRLGGTGLIISTNIELRRDGLPYAVTKEPDDAGVAVYFTYKKRQMCFACDRWKKSASNLQAIAKTIEALRGVARWGTGDMMEAAFTGFAALPAPGQETSNWRDIFGVGETTTLSDVERIYKSLRSACHPDKGGDPVRFYAVQRAWEQAQQALC